jgi:hypothetical protein
MVVQVVIRGNKKGEYMPAKESAAPGIFSTWLVGPNGSSPHRLSGGPSPHVYVIPASSAVGMGEANKKMERFFFLFPVQNR